MPCKGCGRTNVSGLCKACRRARWREDAIPSEQPGWDDEDDEEEDDDDD